MTDFAATGCPMVGYLMIDDPWLSIPVYLELIFRG